MRTLACPYLAFFVPSGKGRALGHLKLVGNQVHSLKCRCLEVHNKENAAQKYLSLLISLTLSPPLCTRGLCVLFVFLRCRAYFLRAPRVSWLCSFALTSILCDVLHCL